MAFERAEATLHQLSREINDQRVFGNVVDTLLRIHRNVNDHVGDPHFRKLSRTCDRVRTVLATPGGSQFLHMMGWRENKGVYTLPKTNNVSTAIGVLLKFNYATKQQQQQQLQQQVSPVLGRRPVSAPIYSPWQRGRLRTRPSFTTPVRTSFARLPSVNVRKQLAHLTTKSMAVGRNQMPTTMAVGNNQMPTAMAVGARYQMPTTMTVERNQMPTTMAVGNSQMPTAMAVGARYQMPTTMTARNQMPTTNTQTCTASGG